MILNTPEAWSEQAEIADPYEAVRWSKEGQKQRHKAVVSALRARRGETLLDYGCGLGALVNELPPFVTYLGYDWAPGMVQRASREHPTFDFTDEEPRGSFELTAVIGTFNLPGDGLGVLGRLWRRTTRALAASLYNGEDTRCHSFDPKQVAAWADYYAERWTLKRHRDNDLLLLLEREEVGGS